MNIEFRIAQLEHQLSDIAARRNRVHATAAPLSNQKSAVAGWTSLEQGVRTVLTSLKLQRATAEASVQEPCA